MLRRHDPEIRRFTEYEHIENPIQPFEGWIGYEQFEYRVSWRVYTTENGDFRDYHTCEDESSSICEQIEKQFGPMGPEGRWHFNWNFLYLFFRTKQDFVEFRLSFDLPS